MLGYCPLCQKLVTIVPLKRELRDGMIKYKPIPHDNARGEICPGAKI